MQIKFKNYKLKKTKSILKKKDLIFLYHSINEKNQICLKTKQNLFKTILNLNYYKIDTSLLNLVLKNSIFFNLSNLIKGPIVIFYFNELFIKKNFLINKLFDITNNNMNILCLIFKNKIYHIKSLLSFLTFNFLTSVKYFIFFLKYFTNILFVTNFLILKLKKNSK